MNAFFWNLYARVYDQLNGLIPYRELQDGAARIVYLNKPATILDAGCGTGNMLNALGPSLRYASRITAVDAAPGMLKRARSKTQNRSNPIAYLTVDLNQPLASQGVSGPFEAIVSINVLYALRSPHDHVRDLASIASPGAILVASTPMAGASQLAILNAHVARARANGQRGRRVSKFLSLLLIVLFNLVIQSGNKAKVFHFATSDDIHAWFTDSGWNIQELTHTYADQNWLITARKE